MKTFEVALAVACYVAIYFHHFSIFASAKPLEEWLEGHQVCVRQAIGDDGYYSHVEAIIGFVGLIDYIPGFREAFLCGVNLAQNAKTFGEVVSRLNESYACYSQILSPEQIKLSVAAFIEFNKAEEKILTHYIGDVDEDKENDGEKVEEEKSKELKICAQCNKKIEGKFLLRALDQFWHEECLKCSYCNTQLSDLSFKFYIKGDQILCKRDYIRLFGATGICSRCLKIIPPLEMVMRAREHVYHLDCFACHVCRYRFCVGDRFYLYYNTIRCQDHYYGDRGYFYQTPFFW